MASKRRRIVAYDVLGDVRGQLPEWLDYRYTNPLNALPTLEMRYPHDAEGSDLLDDWHEVRYERCLDDDNAYAQDFNGCLYLVGFSDDRRDRSKPMTLKYQGLAGLMQYAPIPAALDDAGNPPDAELGATRPVRKFKDDTPGQVMKKLLDSAQDAGWCPAFEWTFGTVNDSAGLPWPDLVTFEVPIGWSPFAVLEMLTAKGYCDWRMFGRSLRMYVPDTEMRRDLSIGAHPTILRHGMGVEEAPLERTYVELATDVLGVAEDGKVLTDHNASLVLPTGVSQLWRTVSLSGIEDDATAAYALDVALQAGKEPREQRVRKVNYEWEQPLSNGELLSALQPGKDFRPGDVLDVENKVQPDGEIGRAAMRVVEFIITEARGTGQNGWITLNDRQETHQAKMMRNLAQLTGGMAGGNLGSLRIPGDDPRTPDISAEADPTITPATYADNNNRPRGMLTITQVWATSTAAFEPDGTASADPIKIKEWIYQTKQAGQKWRDATRMDADDTSDPLVITGLDHLSTVKIRRAAASHEDKLSAWEAFTDITFPADEDGDSGANLIYDWAHVNDDIRNKRAAEAGAGFSFNLVSGEYVAQFTTTTPALDYGSGGNPKSGRRAVRAGDTLICDIQAMRSGGTAAAIQVRVRFWDKAGAILATSNIIAPTTVTTSYVTYSGTLTVPAGAAMASLRVSASTISGGAILRVKDANLDRQAVTNRIGVDQVTEDRQATGSTSSRVLANLSVIEAKNADNSTSRRTIVAKAVDNGKTEDDAQDPRTIGADAVETAHVAPNTHIDGTLTAGNVTIGGLSAQEVEMAGGASMGDNGGGGLVFQSVTSTFIGDVDYTGDLTDISTRESKANIRPLSLARAKKLLGVQPVLFKRRDSWMREKTKRVYPAHDLPARWVKDPDNPGKKKWAEAEHIPERVIPGRTDPRPKVGFVAEELADAELEELVARKVSGELVGRRVGSLEPYLLLLVQDLTQRLEVVEGQTKDQTSGASAPAGE